MSTRKRERHGQSNSPTYHTWAMMKQRCYKVDSAAYRHYGARGIKVCDRWRNSFSAFVADMGERPAGMSLDRIDNDGDYTPENCRWATPKQQANNTSRTRHVTINGHKRPLSYVAADLEIEPSAILYRLKRGWSPEQAVGLEPHWDARAITIGDETLTIAQWAARNGLSRQAVHQRLQRGWIVEDALTKPRLAKNESHLKKRPRAYKPRARDGSLPHRVGAFVTQLRTKHDLTQKEMAELLGVSVGTINRIELGAACPSLTICLEIVTVFGVSFDELVDQG